MMSVLMTMTMAGQAAGEAVWLKHLDRFVVVNVHPVERLAQSGIIGCKQSCLLCFNGKMKVAHGPADDGSGVRFHIKRNLQHRLGFLSDDIPRLVADPDDIAMAEGCLAFETKLRAILGLGAPQAFGKFPPIHAHGYFKQRVID